MLFVGLLIVSWISAATTTDCIQREIDPTGYEYRGFNTKSLTGHKCKPWGYQNQDFPAAGLKDNLCRNPGNSFTTPWCHTTGPYGWAGCEIPDCKVLECVSDEKDRNGRKYRGHQNTAKDGKKCLDWSETKHHPDMIPDAGLEDGNYCRNPGTTTGNDRPFYRSKPWCYTSEKKISYCDVPYCEDILPTDEQLDFDMFGLATGCIPYDEDPLGAKYRGLKRETKSNKVCQMWHDFDRLIWPFSHLDEAACRNPGGVDSAPWCYTGPNSWDYCDIPACVERDLVCSEGELICLDANQCISAERNCDGFPDCDDGSDEVDCT